MAATERNEVVCSEGDDFQCIKLLKDRIDAVCLIETALEDCIPGEKRRGTGLLHTADGYEYEYFYYMTAHGSMKDEGSKKGKQVQLRPERMFLTKKELDYTFVGVDKADIDGLNLTIQPILMEPEPELKKWEKVIIIQHPEGQPKLYSQGEISNVEKPWVLYKANTADSSSGSPVLTPDGLALIAVHQKRGKESSYRKEILISGILKRLEEGTGTKTSGSFLDSQDEIFEDPTICSDETSSSSSKSNGLHSTKLLKDEISAVCFIEIYFKNRNPGKVIRKQGSGFLAKLIMPSERSCVEIYGVVSNHHVLGLLQEAKRVSVIFGYEGSEEGKRVALRKDIMFRTSPELDYTFVGVDKADIDGLNLNIQPILLEPEPELKKGENVMIIQHPDGQPKLYSQGEISNVEKPFVLYKANTAEGSSGSPVLTSDGLALIAVHQRGSKDLSYNKGTLTSEILMHLKEGTDLT